MSLRTMGRGPGGAVGVVVGLAALVAATAHPSVWAPARRGVADPVTLLAIVTIAFGASLAAAVALAVVRVRAPRLAWGAWLPGVVVVASLTSLAAISRVELHPEAPLVSEARADGSLAPPLLNRILNNWRGPAERNAEQEAGAPEVAGPAADAARLFRRLVLALGALALGLLLVLRRSGAEVDRAGDPQAAERAARAAARDAVLSTIEEMLGDPDPRTAIIGAYARLQQELEASGASRWHFEGPTEHLHRVLGVLDVRPGPLGTLIGLFEIARFSDHSLTARHRNEALAALRAVAADLAGPHRVLADGAPG